MKMISIQIPVDSLAQAVADEIAKNRKRGSRQRIMSTDLEKPAVKAAIADLLVATDKVDRDQHSRGEAAALNELFTAAKALRQAVRFANIIQKRESRQ